MALVREMDAEMETGGLSAKEVPQSFFFTEASVWWKSDTKLKRAEDACHDYIPTGSRRWWFEVEDRELYMVTGFGLDRR